MGHGASINKKVHCAPQDEAMSFKAKLGSLKMILTSDGSKSAFMKYLENHGEGKILNYYLDIDELKYTSPSHLKLKIKSILNSYDTTSSSEHSRSWYLQIQKIIDETFSFVKDDIEIDIFQLSANIKVSQDLIGSMLAETLDDFLKSEQYLLWHHIQHENAVERPRRRSVPNAALIEDPVHLKYMNVLIVDDSPVHSNKLAHLLENMGYRLRQVNHGRIAQSVVYNYFSNVILLNLSMKTMDPVELVSKIRNIEIETVHRHSHKKEFSIAYSKDDASVSSASKTPSSTSNNLRKPSFIIGINEEPIPGMEENNLHGIDKVIIGPFDYNKFYEMLCQRELEIDSNDEKLNTPSVITADNSISTLNIIPECNDKIENLTDASCHEMINSPSKIQLMASDQPTLFITASCVKL